MDVPLHNVQYLFLIMVTIFNAEAHFDFNLQNIAALFGITLDDSQPNKNNCALVLAQVSALVRDMVLRQKEVPDQLWDVILTLSECIEAEIYPAYYEEREHRL